MPPKRFAGYLVMNPNFFNHFSFTHPLCLLLTNEGLTDRLCVDEFHTLIIRKRLALPKIPMVLRRWEYIPFEQP